MVDEATTVFAGYNTNNYGKFTRNELTGRCGPRSAMARFLKAHSKEIRRDRDGILTRPKAIGNAERMFDKTDHNEDGTITVYEMETSRR